MIPTGRHVLFTADARFVATPANDGQPARVEGLAIPWNQLSTDRGGYYVRLLPGSAKFAPSVRALYEHDRTRGKLANAANGSLRMTSDAAGVRITIDLPDTNLGRDCFVEVRDQLVRGMSFGMDALPWTLAITRDGKIKPGAIAGKSIVAVENGQTIVTVTGAGAFTVNEFTITDDPAFTGTSIGVAPPTPPMTQPGAYSVRTAHSLRVERARFEGLGLAGIGLPRGAN